MNKQIIEIMLRLITGNNEWIWNKDNKCFICNMIFRSFNNHILNKKCSRINFKNYDRNLKCFAVDNHLNSYISGCILCILRLYDISLVLFKLI